MAKKQQFPEGYESPSAKNDFRGVYPGIDQDRLKNTGDYRLKPMSVGEKNKWDMVDSGNNIELARVKIFKNGKHISTQIVEAERRNDGFEGNAHTRAMMEYLKNPKIPFHGEEASFEVEWIGKPKKQTRTQGVRITPKRPRISK